MNNSLRAAVGLLGVPAAVAWFAYSASQTFTGRVQWSWVLSGTAVAMALVIAGEVLVRIYIKHGRDL